MTTAFIIMQEHSVSMSSYKLRDKTAAGDIQIDSFSCRAFFSFTFSPCLTHRQVVYVHILLSYEEIYNAIYVVIISITVIEQCSQMSVCNYIRACTSDKATGKLILPVHGPHIADQVCRAENDEFCNESKVYSLDSLLTTYAMLGTLLGLQ